MAYAKFSLSDALSIYGLTTDDTQDLFGDVAAVEPSDWLKATLEQNVSLARRIATEKARSELIIAPMLVEAWRRTQPNTGFFSGVEFNVDEAQGLAGFCDYLFTRSREHAVITAPVVAIVAAKKEDLKPGMGQCIAEMVAARIFNERKGNDIPVIWGR